ncbi:MAG: hypothetical protein WAU36_05165 [Cyclobacteriaceae bacterium]
MDTKTKQRILNIASLICGIWFLVTSWFWAWLINVIFSFPIGLLGVIFLYFGRKYDDNNRLNKISIIIHGLGLASAIISFALFYIFN